MAYGLNKARVYFITLLILSLQSSTQELPKAKRSSLGLYLTAQDAYELKRDEDRALFIDIRSLAEINFLGMPTVADAHIEYQRLDVNSRFDPKRANFTLSPNHSFVDEVKVLVNQRGLSESAKLILMCRSGSRSAQAANELAQFGFTQVYSITDGYEGDKVRIGPSAGQRILNGWKNSDLPWSYKLELSKLQNLPQE